MKYNNAACILHPRLLDVSLRALRRHIPWSTKQKLQESHWPWELLGLKNLYSAWSTRWMRGSTNQLPELLTIQYGDFFLIFYLKKKKNTAELLFDIVRDVTGFMFNIDNFKTSPCTTTVMHKPLLVYIYIIENYNKSFVVNNYSIICQKVKENSSNNCVTSGSGFLARRNYLYGLKTVYDDNSNYLGPNTGHHGIESAFNSKSKRRWDRCYFGLLQTSRSYLFYRAKKKGC